MLIRADWRTFGVAVSKLGRQVRPGGGRRAVGRDVQPFDPMVEWHQRREQAWHDDRVSDFVIII